MPLWSARGSTRRSMRVRSAWSRYPQPEPLQADRHRRAAELRLRVVGCDSPAACGMDLAAGRVAGITARPAAGNAGPAWPAADEKCGLSWRDSRPDGALTRGGRSRAPVLAGPDRNHDRPRATPAAP